MGKDSEDKVDRVLSIYNRLKQGKVIYKEKESLKYNVAPRTIQRDIANIQCFLQNQSTESGEIQEIVFDKMTGGYILQMRQKQQLEAKEILAVAKIMLESRALTRNELFPILQKIINLCSDEAQIKLINELLQNEMYHYVELKHGKPLLDCIWKLEQAVKNQNYLEIKYRKQKNQEVITRKIKPVAIMFSEYYFYITAFIEDENIRKDFEVLDDAFPTIYRVDRIQSVKLLDEKFYISYSNRFEEGEFRKRIQFMYGGKLQKIKFKYFGTDVDFILDRLPTATILSDEDGVYIISAEVFGKGIDMWLKSQGNLVEIYE